MEAHFHQSQKTHKLDLNYRNFVIKSQNYKIIIRLAKR